MKLSDLLGRKLPPEPWSEGDKIPWDDPDFSYRMLKEHLSQIHDKASRRANIIDSHVAWIDRTLLHHHESRILDLGCGPGLYTDRLGSLGHQCVGIDFSPAAVEYAQRQAGEKNVTCRYIHDDLRDVGFGSGFDLVMLIFGEFNMFRPEDALRILRKAHDALEPPGLLLLEAHTYSAIEAMGSAGTSWRSSPGGLLSERPHLQLNESFWDQHRNVATRRMFIVDNETADVTRYVETAQAYTLEDYRSLLASAGFKLDQTLPTLPGSPESEDFVVLVASRD